MEAVGNVRFSRQSQMVGPLAQQAQTIRPQFLIFLLAIMLALLLIILLQVFHIKTMETVLWLFSLKLKMPLLLLALFLCSCSPRQHNGNDMNPLEPPTTQAAPHPPNENL